MTIGNIITLTDEEKGIMSDAIDDMIANWGKDCKLIYPARQAPCNNCNLVQTPGGGFRSLNTYKPGGPVPFRDGTLCPVCGGKALRTLPEVTEVIKLLCRWNPSQFILLAGNIQVPFSVVETEGYLSDWPKVQQARVIILELPIQPIIRARFELAGEGVDVNSIVQGKTFTCHWNRRG